MTGTANLKAIAIAAKKLERLDPDYAARIKANRYRRHRVRRGKIMVEIAKEFSAAYDRLVAKSEIDEPFADDVVSVQAQDAAIDDLACAPTAMAPVSTRHSKPTAFMPKLVVAKRFEIDGQSKTLLQWSQVTGVDLGTIRGRVARKWAIKDAVGLCGDRKLARSARLYTFGEQSKSLVEWAEATGINIGTLNNRLRVGWTLQDALTIKVGMKMGTRSHRGWCKTLSKGARTSGVHSRDISSKQGFWSHDRSRRRQASLEHHLDR